MENSEVRAKMYEDLFSAEIRAVAEHDAVTRRGMIYLALGLPLDDVLAALKISRATWYRRVQDLKHHTGGAVESGVIKSVRDVAR